MTNKQKYLAEYDKLKTFVGKASNIDANYLVYYNPEVNEMSSQKVREIKSLNNTLASIASGVPLNNLSPDTRAQYIKAFRRLEKRGYTVDESGLFPESYDLSAVYTQSYRVTNATGEAIPGLIAYHRERSGSSQKAVATRKYSKGFYVDDTFVTEADVIVDSFKNLLLSFPRSNRNVATPGRDYLLDWVEDLVSRYGKNNIAMVLKTAEENGYQFDSYMAYDINEARIFSNDVFRVLSQFNFVDEDEIDEIRSNLSDEYNFSGGF